jgi:hypothetical protein
MADDEVVQVKSRAGQRSPVIGGGQEVGGGVSGELVRPEKRREKEGKGGGCDDDDSFKPAHGGGGLPAGWRHMVGEDQERDRGGGSRPTGGWCPTGSGPRPAGAGGVARPCRAAGRIGEGEGTDWWNTATVPGSGTV